MSVIQLIRFVEITEDEHGLLAQEVSTYGVNKPRESFEDYCERMNYHECRYPANFPVPMVI